MSVLNTLPAPVVQMGLVEKLVADEQNQPLVQQIVAQQNAGAALKAQKERVSEVDSAEHGKKVREREAGSGRQEQRHMGQRRQGEADEEDSSTQSGPHRANPWAGHIVNVKI